MQDRKRFTLHIWRKGSGDDDVIIGDAIIDLSVLVACLPSIDGWFNIIHSSGSINGQIKVIYSTKDTRLKLKSHIHVCHFISGAN